MNISIASPGAAKWARRILAAALVVTAFFVGLIAPPRLARAGQVSLSTSVGTTPVQLSSTGTSFVGSTNIANTGAVTVFCIKNASASDPAPSSGTVLAGFPIPSATQIAKIDLTNGVDASLYWCATASSTATVVLLP